METKAAAPARDLRAARKAQVGRVVSDKMDKTRVVLVGWNTTHSRYQKVIRRSTRFYAHDEKNDSHAGDLVEIMETRPISKLKRWRVTRVVEKNA